MRKLRVLIWMGLLFSVNFASAGGGGSVGPVCAKVDTQVIGVAPIDIYLQDGNTKAIVGEAKLVSRRELCAPKAMEVVSVEIELHDRIAEYNLDFKKSILSAYASSTTILRLKEFIASTSFINPDFNAKTDLTFFGAQGGRLQYQIEESFPKLFWQSPKMRLYGLVTAQAETEGAKQMPVTCALERVYFQLTMKPDQHNKLAKDLRSTASFSNLELCK